MADKKYWKKMVELVEKWMSKSDPSIVVLYMPKPGKTCPWPPIKYTGSPNLTENFIKNEDVRKCFIDAMHNAVHSDNLQKFMRPEDIKKHSLMEAMPVLEEDCLEAPMQWKRGKLSETVKVYMKKTKNMGTGYWGKDSFKPEFWPQEIPFKSPTTNRDYIIIRKCPDIYKAFIQYLCIKEAEVWNTVI